MTADWLTREEWAKHRRTVYEYPNNTSLLASDYATAAEIAEAIAALRAHKQAGRDDDADREYYRRREINSGVRDLKAGRMPWRWVFNPPPQAFKLIFDRYQDACRQEQEAYAQKVANMPIDDEAWQRELAFRERIDRTGGITVC